MSITIRLERPEDYRDTEILTREAFWDVYKEARRTVAIICFE